MKAKTREQLVTEIVQLHAKMTVLEQSLRRYETDHARSRESEKRYRTVFENTGAGTFVKEADMTISMVNQEFEELTGYAKETIEGQMKWTDFFHPDDQPRLIRYHAQRRKDQSAPNEMECRICHRTGIIKEVFLKLDLIPGTDQTIGSIVDLSPLKQAQREINESRALFKAIVEGFEGLLYVTAADFRLEYLNPQCQQRVGSDAVGRICYQAIHKRESPCLFCVQDQVLNGQTARFEMINPKDQRWYHSTNSPIHHMDGSVSLLAMVTDINDCKQAEAALRAAEIQTRNENIFLRRRISKRQRLGKIVGKSPAMQKVYEQIIRAAAGDATVIIYGEPGTGKELVAHAIHDLSDRQSHRFVPVHCGAIPENLIESELFGYKKGAFSGADDDRAGRFDVADNGTMFLDEIGEISLHMQVKLLRVIEGTGFTPVGSSQLKYPNIRIISATNRDLRRRIATGRMREDFYYRIHILPIQLPPLRERKADLPLLVAHFYKLYGGKNPPPPLTQKMMNKLDQYHWPGNIRELQNVIIRYCSLQILELGSGVAQPFPLKSTEEMAEQAHQAKDLKSMLAVHERQLITQALETNLWHRGKAAAQLKIDRKTLFSKMKRYNLG